MGRKLTRSVSISEQAQAKTLDFARVPIGRDEEKDLGGEQRDRGAVAAHQEQRQEAALDRDIVRDGPGPEGGGVMIISVGRRRDSPGPTQ